mmetsp:Transcript_14209/g.30013  ORF Transcript_14209/g.30013 Transcript_14209/m.30013 type:complete len:163 (-) Transcript_14209:758-1246(-)
MARAALQNAPTLIEAGKLRFLVMDSPTSENLDMYLAATNGLNIGAWVRCCEECSYSEDPIRARGISVYNLAFPDGEAPPKTLISKWLDLCLGYEKTIAVHCVAGLGRAPLLVAIALIESGCDAMEAVEIIRRKRRGAINRVQLQYLQEYKPTRRKHSGCEVM